MAPPIWSVLAIVAITGGGAALLFTQDPAPATEAHATGDPSDFDPLDLEASDCARPINATLAAACDAAGLATSAP